MRPVDYVRARTVDETVRLKASNPAAKFLGGGTNLVDLLKYDIEDTDQLIDLTRLPLAQVDMLPEGGLRIGALVRNSDLAAHPRLVASYPVLSQALLAGASPQLRNMATTGGNLLQRTRAITSTTRRFRATSVSPAAAVRQSAATIASTPSLDRAMRALRLIRVTWRWRWPRSTR